MKAIVRNWLSFLGLSGQRPAPPLPFDLLFQYFREVLESKNRALEIIADMGETLGGDYLFDITYIRNAYTELHTSVKNSLELFDKLTRGRYAELSEIEERIDRQVRLIIDGTRPSEGELIIFHRDIAGDRSHAVGGKNSNLAELGKGAKVNVPGGFAITTHAFDAFIRHNNLGEKIQSLRSEAGFGQAAGEVREAVLDADIPASLAAELEDALARIRGGHNRTVFLAVRSSAAEEDGEFSFAGQFETFLNVPAEPDPVREAYKKVVASLFSLKSAEYHRKAGLDIANAKMAVCCLEMVDAAVSGVAYSTDPSGRDTVVVTAAWGLGAPIVEGQIEADQYVVRKEAGPRIVEKKTGNKTHMVIGGENGGVVTAEVPAALARAMCLTDEQVLDLSLQAMQIEKHYHRPCDIEWAMDKKGRIFVLQARPLRVLQPQIAANHGAGGDIGGHSAIGTLHRPLMQDKGVVVQKGVAAGRVFILRHRDELAGIPKGAVLVARNDSSEFIRALTSASAIITDIGTPTSHMASLCREFRVPALVNAGDASKILVHGQEITVSLDDDGHAAVYEGTIRELLDRYSQNGRNMEDVYEFRKKRYLLSFITPLNLIDPLMDNFTTEGCRTLHDILRFIHEKSVAELVDKARYGGDMLRKQAAVKLELPVPAGIIIIDIGGGLSYGNGAGKASPEQITSVPLKALVRGMTYPGIWRSEPVALRAADFLSSMMRMSDITAGSGDYVGYNIAVASKEYVNLSIRFGYHFSLIDCYCSENMKNNHIYFRFSGGATDIAKRSRRIQLIANILKEFGFNIAARGDLIIGRLANIPQDDMIKVLDQTGRLISYTRQLDALLHDDEKIALYARNFMSGNYGV